MPPGSGSLSHRGFAPTIVHVGQVRLPFGTPSVHLILQIARHGSLMNAPGSMLESRAGCGSMTSASWASRGRDATTSPTLVGAQLAWQLLDAFTEVRGRELLPQALVELAADLPGVEGAVVIDIEHPQGPDVAAFSGEDVRHLSQLQLADAAGGAGPDALRSGEPVVLQGLADGPSTTFTRAARDLGVGHVHTLPLARHRRTFGSCVAYVRGGEPLRPADLADLRWWVDITAVGLSMQRGLYIAEERAHQLERALRSRVVIEQAKGVLLGQEAADVSAAFDVLRRRARAARVRVEYVARDVVAKASTTPAPPTLPRQRSSPDDA